MTAHGKLPLLFGIALFLWLAAMGGVWRFNHLKNDLADLESLSSNVVVGKEKQYFYKVFQNGKKVGYMTGSQISRDGIKVLRQEVVLKLNMAGKSREMFMQETTSVDSASAKLDYMTFRIQSGTHYYTCGGEIHQDSLLINVKKSSIDPMRRGMFKVDPGILTSATLPFFLHHHPGREMFVPFFDIVDFSPKTVTVTREGEEEVDIDGIGRRLVRYDIAGESGKSVIWLDSLGRLVKASDMELFGKGLGKFSVEQSEHRDLFLLPVETTLGADTIKKFTVVPDRGITNPRSCTFMRVELDGVRAANIDMEAQNKVIRSLNPVGFEIYSEARVDEKKRALAIQYAAADTSLTGSSDYIQPKDARIVRTARSIAGAGTDTLAIAHAISRWVEITMKRDDTLVISRSVDLLSTPSGGRDEYVKLFTALSRSLGIPTQINMGLVYEGDRFKYHSWPSVLTGGIWHDIDPWYGQDTADAARISLVRGDFDCLSEYLRLVNSFTIRILEYR